MTRPDYIIVGGGSAGCVLADRLSVDPKNNVLLLEAGPDDSSPLIHMPRGSGKLFTNPSYMWFYQTEQHDGVPAETWIRGKVLGGSSAVNGMVYFRGQPQDYDGWERLGARGWGWSQIGECFREMEDHELGADGVRGHGGPLGISIARDRSPFTEAFIQAGEQMGVRRVEDLNRPEQEGVGYIPRTIRNGRRQSAASAFLKAARKRKNLRVVTGAIVDRLLFDGKRVSGVIVYERGQVQEYRTGGEVVVCAGALSTPLILERSGIGNADRLRKLGIGVVFHSPGVGEHMLEHRLLMIRHDMTIALSDNLQYRGLRLAKNVLRYYLTRSGALASGHASVGAFIRAHPDSETPDSEILMAPLVPQANAKGQFETEPKHSVQVFGYPLRSRSEGSIHIRSADPSEAPIIHAGYLTDPYDRKITVAMHRFIRRWLGQSALAGMVGPEREPTRSLETDDEIIAGFRELGTCGVHACGTSRMGSFNDAVLDERLRVRGVAGLRIVDGSIMPAMVSANTNGPIMASAWRASKLILEDRRERASA